MERYFAPKLQPEIYRPDEIKFQSENKLPEYSKKTKDISSSFLKQEIKDFYNLNSIEISMEIINYNKIFELYDIKLKDQSDKKYDFSTIKFPTYTISPLTPSIPQVKIPAAPNVDISQTPAVDINNGYQLLTSERTREELLTRTIQVIHAMAFNDTDAVIVCDRGARPIGVLTGILLDELWDSVSPTGKPRPPIFFINSNPKHRYNRDASDVPPETLLGIKSWLESQYPDGPNPFRENEEPVNITIIDENIATGKTTDFIAAVVERAFDGAIGNVAIEDFDISSLPWRNDEEMIGAGNFEGSFISTVLSTESQRLLHQDLDRLAEEVTNSTTN